MKIGVAKAIITPPLGAPLVGYFTPRPNVGVLDDLYVRAMLFEQDGLISGVVTFDLCFLSTQLIKNIRKYLDQFDCSYSDNLIFNATHTHTGPYVDEFFGAPADEEYLNFLASTAATTIFLAQRNLAESQLLGTRIDGNPCAFNRRYFMKDGKVLTNPGFLNPNIERPEGPVDNDFTLLAVKRDDKYVALMVNLVNHTDTIGGDYVSSDWPGRMEREIQTLMGYDVPVFTLIGCSGNINHFDVSNDIDQTSYAEACRIGRLYGKMAFEALDKLEVIADGKMRVKNEPIVIPFRDNLTEADVAAAQATIDRIGDKCDCAAMTSEELASGDGPVAKFFAEQMILYYKNSAGKKRSFDMVSIKLGDAVDFVTLPGEPFTEIGMAIKAASKAKFKLVVALAMGECGYIPLKECFDRGGYEILPVDGGSPREDTAERLTAKAIELIK